MIKRLVLFLAIFTSLRQSIACAGSREDALRDFRVAYETLELNFWHIDAARDENWAILRVTEGPYDDADAGRIAKLPPPASRHYALEFIPGTATCLGVLQGSAPPDSWPCYIPIPKRILFTGHPLVTQDESPGTSVCRLSANMSAGRAVVEEAYLIPTNWAEHLKRALELQKANQDAFLTPRDPQHQKKLIELMKSDNPVLEYLVYKTLALSSGLSVDDVAAEVMNRRDVRGIIVNYLVLRFPVEGEPDAAFHRFSQRIEAAGTTEQLRGIASACALDLEADPSKPTRPTNRPSYRLLVQIEAREALLSKGGKPDEYLNEAMVTMRRLRHLAEWMKTRQKAQTRPGA